MKNLRFPLHPVNSPFPAWRGQANSQNYRMAASACLSQGGRLVALWGSDNRDLNRGFSVFAALAFAEGLLLVEHPIHGESTIYPTLSDAFPYAARMERAVYDLLGIRSSLKDQRPWLAHGKWPAFPLRRDMADDFSEAQDNYQFVVVEGDGVHEIAVGPVHAGTIESGHFRFQVVGEKVLRLEERLGFKHKGIERRFYGLAAADGAKLAARVSGDSAVAYGWAYSMAVESLAANPVPARALSLRGLLLERERIVNHLGDLGALGNDTGLAFGLAQFSRLRERMLRTNARLFGHRLAMDQVVPGGVVNDIDDSGIEALVMECELIGSEVRNLRSIYLDHSGLQDRFLNCGKVEPELAARLGLTGIAGRASRIAYDLRENFPYAPYDKLDVEIATHSGGDVAARASVRFDEVFESLRLIREIAETMPQGEIRSELAVADGNGIGWVEGWRGEVLFAIELENGLIRRAHPHDPSWQNWPVLEHAIIGNIVPDFPLINKSFNLSYSGHDL